MTTRFTLSPARAPLAVTLLIPISPACPRLTFPPPLPSLSCAAPAVSSSYPQLHEGAIFSMSCREWKRSVGRCHRCVLVGEVSHWGPGCAFSQLHGSNRPDAPRGDERASVAVSQHCYYFTLHERRMKREEEGVTYSTVREMETTTMVWTSRALVHKHSQPVCFSVDICLPLLATLRNPGHLSVIYPIKLKWVWFDRSWSSLSPWEQYGIVPLGDWLSDRFCQPQHSQ